MMKTHRLLQLWVYKSFVRHSFDLDWAFFVVFLEIKTRVELAFLQILSCNDYFVFVIHFAKNRSNI